MYVFKLLLWKAVVFLGTPFPQTCKNAPRFGLGSTVPVAAPVLAAEGVDPALTTLCCTAFVDLILTAYLGSHSTPRPGGVAGKAPTSCPSSRHTVVHHLFSVFSAKTLFLYDAKFPLF